jgi:hypothetical protein
MFLSTANRSAGSPRLSRPLIAVPRMSDIDARAARKRKKSAMGKKPSFTDENAAGRTAAQCFQPQTDPGLDEQYTPTAIAAKSLFD